MKDSPHRGLKVLYKCISCDAEGMQPVVSIKKNSTNADGSVCYTIKLKCAADTSTAKTDRSGGTWGLLASW